MLNSELKISLPEAMKLEIEEIIASEGYSDVSEFFCGLVRNYLKERQKCKLEALLNEGLESGEATPLTREDFEATKQRGLSQLLT